MGSSLGHGALGKYIIPGAETAVGVGSEIIAPGNPIGLALAGSGVGQLAGGAAGGSSGQNLGGALGGLAGGAYGMAGAPGMSSLTGMLGGGGGITGGGLFAGLKNLLGLTPPTQPMDAGTGPVGAGGPSTPSLPGEQDVLPGGQPATPPATPPAGGQYLNAVQQGLGDVTKLATGGGGQQQPPEPPAPQRNVQAQSVPLMQLAQAPTPKLPQGIAVPPPQQGMSTGGLLSFLRSQGIV